MTRVEAENSGEMLLYSRIILALLAIIAVSRGAPSDDSSAPDPCLAEDYAEANCARHFPLCMRSF